MSFGQNRFGSSAVNSKTSIHMEGEMAANEFAKNKCRHLYESRKSGRIIVVLAFFLTFIILIPYTLRFKNGQLNPMISRLSQDCESTWQNGFFNICLYLISLIGMGIVTLRYMYVSNLIDEVVPKMRLINKYGLWCGYTCFSGFLLIASAPIDYKLGEDLQLHLSSSGVGGFVVFFFGALYISFQTSITFFYFNENKRVLTARIFIFLSAAITFATYCIIVNTITKYNEKPVFPLDSHKISLETGNVSLFKRLNVLGAVCEWMTSILFAFYFMTFAKECQQIWVEVTFVQEMRIQRGSESPETAM